MIFFLAATLEIAAILQGEDFGGGNFFAWIAEVQSEGECHCAILTFQAGDSCIKRYNICTHKYVSDL